MEARIVYMGTPEISAHVLRSLIEHGYNIVGLITNEDKEVGRKHILEPTPCKKVALEFGVPVFQPHRIRLEHEFLKDLKPDVIVTFAYGQIVPDEVLNCPKHGCINLHGSLLPKLRGAAPIQRAIMNGDTKTGVTLMEMVSAMDAGKMYDKEEVDILEDDTYTSLSHKISLAAEKLILRDLNPYLEGKLPGVPQDESEVTFADKIKPEHEHLPLEVSAHSFVRYAHGLSEEPGGYLLLNNEKLKIYKAKVANNNVTGKLGEIVEASKRLLIQLQDGQVEILDLQLQGKKRMDARSFLNGQRNLLGAFLS